MVTKRTLICLTRMDSTTTSPANVVIMAWSSRPERMSSWLSTATMMPMAAILKISREYEQTFRRGDPDGPLKCIGTVDPSVTGTRVTFKPDPEMFKDTTVYNFETLEKRLREESFLNAGVKITLTDERELPPQRTVLGETPRRTIHAAF